MPTIPILHADIRGEGPTLVLVHGFLSSSQYWKQLAGISEKEYKIIALDLLGFGKSPKPRKSSYDYDEHLASINATLTHLGVNEPFILMGHSMGALIALRYSIQHEQQVSKLVLANMPVMIGKEQVKSEILQTSFAYKYGLNPSTHRLTWSAFKVLYALQLLPSRTMKTIRQNKYFFQHSPSSRIKSFQEIIQNGRADIDLRIVRVKTLVISGLEDRKLYLENLAHNITLSPSVALITVPTGHHIPRAMPDSLFETLKNT